MNLDLAIIILIALFAGISGVNDGGNLVGTFLASRLLPVRWLIPVLVIGIGAGPFLFGTAVSHTIAVEIVSFQQAGRMLLAVSLFAALLSLVIAWILRVPSSTTIALAGGMIGAAWSQGNGMLIHWQGVLKVALGMVGSVLIGFLVAYIFARLVWLLLGKVKESQYHRGFAYLQFLTVCLQGLAYGANDQEKAIGLMALYLLMTQGQTHYAVTVAAIVLPLLFWIAGLFVGGLRIAQTVSGHIVRIRALHAIITQASAAITVILAALVGLPVSTTQTTDGCLFGVGTATGPRRVRWSTVRKLVMVWLMTFPGAVVAGYLSMAFIRIVR